ncbi:MAG TPA: hypothetical protein VHE34_06280 [Puia sp.]|uniref:hypothetical protein n=1 Tax=Puia sp. TaxID=2045100 RepID=UPI002D05157A|nr:hypothetical protein [Puia sp.]HVU94811.1 hypothetical protein [Puia sp.]
MNFQELNKQRKIALVCSVLGIIACLLPWYSYGFGSVNGLNGLGVLVFILFICSGILSFIGDQKANLPSKSWLLVLASGFICFLIPGYYIARILMATGSIGNEEAGVFKSIYGSGFGLGVGIWIAAGAGAVTAAGVYRLRSKNDTIKDSFNMLKNSVEQSVKTPSDGDKPSN